MIRVSVCSLDDVHSSDKSSQASLTSPVAPIQFKSIACFLSEICALWERINAGEYRIYFRLNLITKPSFVSSATKPQLFKYRGD